MNFTVTKNEIAYIDEQNDKLAYVNFIYVYDNVIELNHTYVSDTLRGKGVAGLLMEETVKFLKTNSLRIVPTCSYAKGWFLKHEEYKDLLK